MSTLAGEPVNVVVDVCAGLDSTGHLDQVTGLGWAGVDAAQVASRVDATLSGGSGSGPCEQSYCGIPFELIGLVGQPYWSLTIGEEPPAQ